MAELTFTFQVSQDEDGAWIAQCIENPGIITDADSLEALGENVIEAVEAVLELRAIDREQNREAAAPALTLAHGLTVSGGVTAA